MRIYIRVAKYLVVCSAIALSLDSCGGENNEIDELLSGQEVGTNDPNYQLVKNNISSTVSYADYGWNIKIRSNLGNVLPEKSIVYGLECGYGDYQYYEHFTFRKNTQIDNGNGSMTVEYPVFIGNVYGNENLYWYSYKGLKAKKEKGETLTSDEQDLWNDILKYMNQKENNAKSEFCGRLYAQFDNNRYFFQTFGIAPIPSSGGSGSGSGASGNGSSSSYEKPELGLMDYTCYTTSITVRYRIYNQDKAKVSSAKGYYGKSSPSSSKTATVAGSLITINLTGLSKGTTYYIKCSATGPAGTATSEVVKLTTFN